MNLKKLILLFPVFLLFIGCPSDDDEDDCFKTITIPQFYFINNQSYSYETSMEVPCDFPEPSEPELIEPPVLANFSYEVLSFNFTPDTGNNTSRLQFEIKLLNGNSYAVKGIPVLTMNIDGFVSSGPYSNYASIPCHEIGANSECTLTVDVEESLDLGIINSIELVDVQYFLTN